MKQPMIRWPALVMALALAGAGHVAWAQSEEGMPPVMHAGSVAYVTGGVGLDESTALKRAMASGKYPLAVQLYGASGEYLSDVPVKITDMKKRSVFEASSQGPFMLVKLPPGQYVVSATHNSKEQRRTVSVPRKGHAAVRFDWK